MMKGMVFSSIDGSGKVFNKGLSWSGTGKFKNNFSDLDHKELQEAYFSFS